MEKAEPKFTALTKWHRMAMEKTDTRFTALTKRLKACDDVPLPAGAPERVHIVSLLESARTELNEGSPQVHYNRVARTHARRQKALDRASEKFEFQVPDRAASPRVL